MNKINVYKSDKTDCDSKHYIDTVTEELKEFRNSIAEGKLDKATLKAMSGLVSVKINDRVIAVNVKGKKFKELPAEEQNAKKIKLRDAIRKFVDKGNIRKMFDKREFIPFVKQKIIPLRAVHSKGDSALSGCFCK